MISAPRRDSNSDACPARKPLRFFRAIQLLGVRTRGIKGRVNQNSPSHYGQTVADSGKVCFERYWEVVGGLSIGANPKPLTLPNSKNWEPQNFPFKLRPNGMHERPIVCIEVEWECGNEISIGTIFDPLGPP